MNARTLPQLDRASAPRNRGLRNIDLFDVEIVFHKVPAEKAVGYPGYTELLTISYEGGSGDANEFPKWFLEKLLGRLER